MGKCCLQASSFIFYRIFVKLAGNQDRHKILDQFEFRPDRISHFWVTCPSGQIKFSIDLLWNDLSDENILGTLWAQLFLKFSTDFRCFLHGMKMCMWFGYFFSLFCFVNLVFFFVWNAIKVYRQWVPCGCNSSYSFPPIVLKLCRCFQHRMKMCMWFWYNTLFFLTFSALWI